MVNVQIMFANNVQFVLTYQIVVWNDAAGNGVFDGHYPFVRRAVQQMVDHFIKRKALDQFNILAKEFFGHLMVVASLDSLYGDF